MSHKMITVGLIDCCRPEYFVYYVKPCISALLQTEVYPRALRKNLIPRTPVTGNIFDR